MPVRPWGELRLEHEAQGQATNQVQGLSTGYEWMMLSMDHLIDDEGENSKP